MLLSPTVPTTACTKMPGLSPDDKHDNWFSPRHQTLQLHPCMQERGECKNHSIDVNAKTIPSYSCVLTPSHVRTPVFFHEGHQMPAQLLLLPSPPTAPQLTKYKPFRLALHCPRSAALLRPRPNPNQ
jgi:hypothetical protein